MPKSGAVILILGGTGQALKLARSLLEQGHSVIYSIAGLVRQPDLPCTVISGGFTQFGGMTNFIKRHRISLIIDATHPYAAQISQHAATAAQSCAIPCWRLQRPAWQATVGDRWTEFAGWQSLVPALAPYKCIFLSHGQLTSTQLNQLVAQRQSKQRFLLRTAVQSELNLPEWIDTMQAIGPFAYDEELALLRRLRVDVLVSKNSGGEMTVAKLEAARALHVPVLFLQRPELPEVEQVFFEVEDVLRELMR